METRLLGMVVIMTLVALVSCDSNSPTDSQQVTGQTSAGRAFVVRQYATTGTTKELRLQVEGEEEVLLKKSENDFGYDCYGNVFGVALTSIRVEEDSNSQLMHIHWIDCNTWDLRSYGYFNYLVVAMGNADTILLQGRKVSTGTGHYGFQWADGSYQLTLGGTVTIVEHQKSGREENETCYAEETILFRDYRITNGAVGLERCEEQYRTAEIPHPGGTCTRHPQLEAALEAAPFADANFTSEQREERCAPIQ